MGDCTDTDARQQRAMRIGVYGLGYVGAVSLACLAELGHEVVGVDINPQKVEAVANGRGPVIEPGLNDMLGRHVASNRLSASTDGAAVAADVDLIMVCVGTPSLPSGGTDSKHLLSAAREVGMGLRANPRPFVVVVNRSTSLPDVHFELMAELEAASGRVMGESLGYSCNPELLRETTAIADFFEPPMVIYGCDSDRTAEVCLRIHPGVDAPVMTVAVGEAAMIKYASNSWHATKVTFANEIGELCRQQGIDSRQVMDLFCLDENLNISAKYLRPGNPFGGSCLPKDLRALLDFARRNSIASPLMQGVAMSNQNQLDQLGDRVLAFQPRRVGLVGLSFKEGTDDLREAPMIPLAERMIGKGIEVGIYDADLAVDDLVGANAAFAVSALPHLAELVTGNIHDVIESADVVVVSHRLAGRVDWTKVALNADTTVIDLVGVPELADHPRYEGIYWGGSSSLEPAQV